MIRPIGSWLQSEIVTMEIFLTNFTNFMLDIFLFDNNMQVSHYMQCKTTEIKVSILKHLHSVVISY